MMELATQLDFYGFTDNNYLKKLSNEILTIVYNYVDPTIMKLLGFIYELEGKLSNEEIYNYFHKCHLTIINNKDNEMVKKCYLYDATTKYTIPKNYEIISSTMDCIKLIPTFYRPISKFTKNCYGVTKQEKHYIEDILSSYYTDLYGNKFSTPYKPSYGYTYRESVILAFLFSKINYTFNGNELQFYLTRKKRITQKELLAVGFYSTKPKKLTHKDFLAMYGK